MDDDDAEDERVRDSEDEGRDEDEGDDRRGVVSAEEGVDGESDGERGVCLDSTPSSSLSSSSTTPTSSSSSSSLASSRTGFNTCTFFLVLFMVMRSFFIFFCSAAGVWMCIFFSIFCSTGFERLTLPAREYECRNDDDGESGVCVDDGGESGEERESVASSTLVMGDGM